MLGIEKLRSRSLVLKGDLLHLDYDGLCALLLSPRLQPCEEPEAQNQPEELTGEVFDGLHTNLRISWSSQEPCMTMQST